MMIFLLVVGITGLFTSTVYALLVALGGMRLVRRRREGLHPGFTPPVSLLKPMHGWEPDLEARLETFFIQDYPQYEVLFCARSEDDPGLLLARQVAARFPSIRSKFLVSGDAPYANAKVWSLERMQAEAAYRFFVISDSDVSVTTGYLRAVMEPFASPEVGLVTCLYRGVGQNIWSELEAVGMSIEMSAGVLVADMLEGMKFALGPTMVVRRDALEAAGGFRALGNYHADDYMLGNLVAAGGHQVVLSTHVIDHHVLNTSFSSSMLHQIRWMQSTRFSRPKGHFGTALTFSIPFALIAATGALAWHRPALAAFLFLIGWSTRVLMALVVGRLVVEEEHLLRTMLLYPVRDFLGFCFWVASYASNQVRWRGQVYNLFHDGSMKTDASKQEAEAILMS
jgi:ceramide glucosyltransferase